MKKENTEKLSFGTDGWRGVVGRDFTFHNVAKVTAGIAAYLKNENPRNHKVLVTYDARYNGERFATTAAQMFRASDFSVQMTPEDVPTPAAAFYAAKKKLCGAVVVTASHNPKEFNGIKFKPDFGGSAPSSVTKKIEREIAALRGEDISDKLCAAANGNRPFSHADIFPHYSRHILSLVNVIKIKQARLKTIIDPMHGSGRTYFETLLKQCGVQAVNLSPEQDPLFEGVQPEPIEKNLLKLKKAMKKGGADIGIALDGDADRIGAFDEKGNFLDSHHVFALLLYYFLEVRKERGGVAETLNTTSMIPKLAALYGVPFYETPVGFKHICELMRTKDILMGGEESGGIGFRGHIPERDGILAGLFLCEMLAVMKKPVSQIVNELHRAAGGNFYYARRDFHVTQEKKEKFLERVNKHPFNKIAGLPVVKYDRYDGHKFTLENGDWLMFRASGTEPLLRVYAESRRRRTLQPLMREGEKLFAS